VEENKMNDSYWTGLARETDKVFKSNMKLKDHRSLYPLLIGALGDPFAGIWFVAENPSLTQVERVQNPDGGSPTIEAQWWSSRGDKLFREMLVKHRFKTGSIESLNGWKCYITNIIKEADYTKDWRDKSQEVRNHAAELWAALFAWELENSKPKLVVVMGKQTATLVDNLVTTRRIHLPQTVWLTHYAYIGQRAQGKLGPMHPTRIATYDQEILHIRKIFDLLS
jgi:hypothetical protein